MPRLVRRAQWKVAWPLALALLAGCGGGGGGSSASTPQPPAAICPIPVAVANPSWVTDVYPILHSSTCGASTTSCHGGPSAQGHIDYSATSGDLRAALITQPPSINLANWAIVKPGDSSLSWLYEKVHPAMGGQPGLAAGHATGSQMPLGGSLCQATTDTFKNWIDQGANP